MLLTVVNIVYVLVAAAMIILILLQRGAGASAGSGFGGGASATVFGARGSANFLSKSTAVLATLFFVISLGMAVYASRSDDTAPAIDDLGVMGALDEVPAAPAPASSSDAAAELPAAPVAEDSAAEPTAEAAPEAPASNAASADEPVETSDKK